MTAKQDFMNKYTSGKFEQKIGFLEFMNYAHIVVFVFVAVYANIGVLTF